MNDRSIYQGLKKSPLPHTVIETICGDWLSIENYNTWDDWADDMGYEFNKEARRQAKRAYNQIIEQSEEAQIFFGNDWSKLCDLSY